MNLPAVIGEIFAGFILGSLSLLFFTGQIITFYDITFSLPKLNYLSHEFDFLAEIGILFLLFISGLSTNLSQIRKIERSSIFVAVGGIVVPLILGIIAGRLFLYSSMDSMIIGLILVATSVGVTVRTLMDLHVLDTLPGSVILGSAVIDDIGGVILLVVIMGTDPLPLVGLKIFLFFFLFLYLGLRVIDKILSLGEKILLPKAFLSISLSIFLLFSFFADISGVSGIIGAFVAGLLIGQSLKSRKIIDDVQTIGYGFFVPLFFIWIGARLIIGIANDLSSLSSIWMFIGVIIFIGIIGKILGCGVGGKLAGLSNTESFQIGVGMIPRMELALIIISTAISRGLLSSHEVEHQFLTVTVMLTFFTTLLTPFLISKAFKIQ